MSLLIAGITVWGFSHTINQVLFHPAVPRPRILWVHGAAFSAWVAFYILQSALVRTRNVTLHRTLGWFGAGLGAFMVPLGIVTAIVLGRFDMYRLHETGVDTFLLIPFYDMAVFLVLFGLALLWRKRLELHRRMMFIATCGLLDAAFGRVDYIFNNGYFYYFVDSVILLGVVRDLIVNRRVHKAYLVALPLLIVVQAFVIHTWMSGAGWWVRIARSILG